MKKLISIVLAVVAFVSLAITPSAYDINTALRTCYNCNTRTLIVTCVRHVRTDETVLVCFYPDHDDGCLITSRDYYSAYGVCTNNGCLYSTTALHYDDHVHSAYHTSTGMSHPTCNYSRQETEYMIK